MFPTFRISKWYMDCVSEAGDVVVVYSTVLRWGPLEKGYSSVLERRGGDAPRTRVSARRFATPRITVESLRWESRRLGMEGEWTGPGPAMETRLLDRDDGFVDWRCTFPNARARLVTDHGRGVVEGLGYAEHLETTLRPWRLPIRELHWGRFVSKDRSVVWIEWRGPHPLQRVWIDGVESAPAIVHEHGLSLAGGIELRLEGPIVLREGPLVSTVFSKTRLLRWTFPPTMLHTHECKWRSRGRLIGPGEAEASGWAIHEVVRWEDA